MALPVDESWVVMKRVSWGSPFEICSLALAGFEAIVGYGGLNRLCLPDGLKADGCR